MRGRHDRTLTTFQAAAVACTNHLENVFPKTPDWPVPKNFTLRLQELQSIIAQMTRAFEDQYVGAKDSRVATVRAEHAQRAVRTQLMVIRRAARALEWEIPGLATKCRVPTLRSRRSTWHGTVRAVLDSATPHFSALVDEGVPPDTLQQITQADATLATATADGIAARQRRAAATRRLPKLVTRGHQLLASLDVTMRAYYAIAPEHAGGAAAWAHATHVRRDPRRSPRPAPSPSPPVTPIPAMRVISLLPAATDIVAALGASDALVGVTHECDYPAEVVRTLPRVTASPIYGATAGDIDRQVREAAHQGTSLFELDEARIRELRPEVLLTQALCDVCAVNEHDVRAIAARIAPTPTVITLLGTTFDGVFTDIMRVASALQIPQTGAALVATLQARLDQVHDTLRKSAAPRPRVAVLEWTDPIYAAGHWVPEMVKRAGGIDVLSAPGTHSTTRTADEVRAAAPEVLCIAPCGYDVSRAVAESTQLLARAEWAWAQEIPVWILNGNVLTSRPGPRIVNGVEVIAAALHPTLFPAPLPLDAHRLVRG